VSCGIIAVKTDFRASILMTRQSQLRLVFDQYAASYSNSSAGQSHAVAIEGYKFMKLCRVCLGLLN